MFELLHPRRQSLFPGLLCGLMAVEFAAVFKAFFTVGVCAEFLNKSPHAGVPQNLWIDAVRLEDFPDRRTFHEKIIRDALEFRGKRNSAGNDA